MTPRSPLTDDAAEIGGAPGIIAVVGPTASGKSDLGLEIALHLGGEVVNADASQFYRGMDIGTAKLTLAERRGVPHHQLDVLEITDEATVAAYQTGARADLDAITERGRVPVLVGGSGLYVRAALDLLDIPPTDPVVRARLEAEATERGGAVMHARLTQADPAAAAKIPPGNVRRVVRALEVIELTGRPFSASMPTRTFRRPTLMLGLLPPREVLDERIAVRARRMWEQGLVAEVEQLLARGLRQGRTASRALGYSQAIAHLDGTMTAEEAIDDTIRATRRYARRQESWFRPDERIRWFDPTEHGALEAALGVARAWLTVGENGTHD
ncbi:tRNA (adenosine(37)-N6)-dimethylallyltransferase MiaA [Kribbia dieselivorans]|uniref:tRNA (adenosine(37)-N6)-dimethylallyltransferase MiaA n=1 Tax=Kribbia dieselivorans TaxID=331526 RepID=UPI0008389AEF|nr:tRNA (adenosine(37)-N6)-dimethylallyltransferase MiaA [Kribbia dieselivorans]